MALSNAERQRRYMARLKRAAKASGDATRWQAEIAALKTEVADLKARLKQPTRETSSRKGDAR